MSRLEAIPVVTTLRHRGHAPEVEVQGGVAIAALDRVERVEAIASTLAGEDGFELVEAREHGLGPLRNVHSDALLEFLQTAWQTLEGSRPPRASLVFADTFLHARLRHGLSAAAPPSGAAGGMGHFCFDTITGIGPDSFDAACGAADAALEAADRLIDGAPLAVALTRPPGHHVTTDLFGGGCYLNNAAIAAQHLRSRGLERVAVLDLDYHHGNGTQAIFYDRADVLFASLHVSPAAGYPFHVGWEDETGRGDGLGANLNVLVPVDVDGDTYIERLARPLAVLRDFAPQALVVSMGFDAFKGDPFDGRLTTEDFERIGLEVGKLAVPTAMVLEGGYDLDHLGANAAAWLRGVRHGLGARRDVIGVGGHR